ncbi:anthranilate/aminodeoxychorismate synthase component II [Saccharospirillum sp. MSK14-1]|uniref:anthranilate synthase component II n=1 Tax=Saccharospirillum sp. MSK14-1 TaxID=1897632 RepID=UPI000D3B6560|nr:aminodeoxychorismate/anthranilate synthase component II [Saccharospirillum sp. MSK14-1]PTY38334.1 anthranilate/aminodeoxychorismate synthase component II [Saccharospirillum sp. MSK14-1]
MRILMLDNHDSFTYNLVHYLQELGAQVVVWQSDATTLADIDALAPDGLMISPGPGTPDDAGISMAAIEHCAGRLPILGVCLGHQCIAQLFGGQVIHAPSVMHGKTSAVTHYNVGVFAGLPTPLKVTRYHSLVVDADRLPSELEATAWVHEGDAAVLMGLRHRHWPIEGVQFHPESILTQAGHDLLANFLRQIEAWGGLE